MTMEFTKAQARNLICPLLSRTGEVFCRTTSCMAWAWSAQAPHAVSVRGTGEAKGVGDLEPPDDRPGWSIDNLADLEPYHDENGVFYRYRYTDPAPVVPPEGKRRLVASVLVRWVRPWDESRLGSCTALAAKVAEIETYSP